MWRIILVMNDNRDNPVYHRLWTQDSVAELVRAFALTTSIALAHDLKVVGSSPERVDSAHHCLNKWNEEDWIGPPTRCGSVVRHCGTGPGPDHLRLHESPSRDTTPTAQRPLGLQARGFRWPQWSFGNEHWPNAYKRQKGWKLVWLVWMDKANPWSWYCTRNPLSAEEIFMILLPQCSPGWKKFISARKILWK